MSSSCENCTVPHTTKSLLTPGFKDQWLLGPGRDLVVFVFSNVCVSRYASVTHDEPLVVYQQPRPGPKLPKGESYLTIGWKQVPTQLLSAFLDTVSYSQLDMDGLEAIRETALHIHIPVRFLPPCRCASHPLRLVWYQSDPIILGLDQGLNTTGTLVSICQNDKFAFSFLQNTYLGLAQAICSTASTLGFWYIQRYWKISTKTMVQLLPYVSLANALISMTFSSL